MKRVLALIMGFVLILSSVTFGNTDDRIFTDPVIHNYTGRSEGKDLINGLQFNDIQGHWAGEAIIRGGALKMIRGEENKYRPNSPVTNEEAIAFIVRMIGLENEALEDANTLKNSLAERDQNLKDIWSIGYISVARRVGILTLGEYDNFLARDFGIENLEDDQYRNSPAKRERIAYWLALGLNSVNEGTIDLNKKKDSIYNYKDWKNIDSQYAAAVDGLAFHNIMKGDTSGNFNPKANLTRGEMAQILRNMDNIYYKLYNIEKKTGTVGGSKDKQNTVTGYSNADRVFYIRNQKGEIETISYEINKDSQVNTSFKDAPVFRQDKVGGLETLQDGDEIEYLIRHNEVIYIQVLAEGDKGKALEESYEGKLHNVNLTDGTITIIDSRGKYFTYNMAQGAYSKENDYVVIDQQKIKHKELPAGNTIRLNLKNKTVDTINHIGTITLIAERRGIVTDNNPEYGYLSFINENGVEETKNYYADSIKVEKQEYYDMDDEIGYIDEVFPNFKYDPRDTDISNIEAGDIIFMRFDENDGDLIINLSASTSYVARYGKIKEIRQDDKLTRILLETEDKQTAWYDTAKDVFVSKKGTPINHSGLVNGDWAKILVNQAIISPGYVMESVKEISVEGDAHYISNIVKGQFAGIEPIQKQLMIQNSQTLTNTGWGDYKNVGKYSIAGNDIEYYHNDKRISLDYANKFLKRANGEVYLALENSPMGERVKKITFRDGRDELLNSDTVLTSDGNGNFSTINNNIIADSGTIIRRHGRLVDKNSIMPSDFIEVSLNGGNTAAVVNITDSPGVSNIMIARGRILSVDQGKSFKVQSMSILNGNTWSYTPVQREFTIDYNTIFFDENGVRSLDNFIDYTEDSVKDKVYNVVYTGGHADRIYEAPFTRNLVKGTIYNINGNNISIKDAKYYDKTMGHWHDISRTNNTLVVVNHENTIMVKNNGLISNNNLQIGDNIRAMAVELPDEILPGTNIDSYITLVDR